MNLLRKTSMILMGAAGAGLLAFACADGEGVGASSADQTAVHPLVISKVYGGGVPAGNPAALKGDFVELHNTTSSDIDLSQYSLQFLTKDFKFDKTVFLSLGKEKLAAGKFLLVNLTPKATYPMIADTAMTTGDIQAPANDDGTAKFALDKTSDSVMLVKNPIDCADSATCAAGSESLMGYGVATDAAGVQHPSIAEGTASPRLSVSKVASRVDNGCQQTGDNSKDFKSGAVILTDNTPRSRLDPAHLCPAAVVVETGDAAADADVTDADLTDASTDASIDAGDAAPPPPPKPVKDAGPKDTGAKDAGPDNADDGSDDGADSTPSQTTGKKKPTSANTPPQPIASSSPSCSTTSGPASSGALAGLAGLGLALASLGRRRRNK